MFMGEIIYGILLKIYDTKDNICRGENVETEIYNILMGKMG